MPGQVDQSTASQQKSAEPSASYPVANVADTVLQGDFRLPAEGLQGEAAVEHYLGNINGPPSQIPDLCLAPKRLFENAYQRFDADPLPAAGVEYADLRRAQRPLRKVCQVANVEVVPDHGSVTPDVDRFALQDPVAEDRD